MASCGVSGYISARVISTCTMASRGLQIPARIIVQASLVNADLSRETSGHSWSKVMALWNVISAKNK